MNKIEGCDIYPALHLLNCQSVMSLFTVIATLFLVCKMGKVSNSGSLKLTLELHESEPFWYVGESLTP